MTRGEFESKYKLISCIAETGVRTYRAMQVASGREVLVHLLDDVSPDQRAELRLRLRQLELEDRARVLEDGDVDGRPLVITDPLPGLTTLPAWLESRAGGISQPGAKTGAPGEFTLLFGAPAPGPVEDLRAPPEPKAPPVIRLGGSPSPQPFPAGDQPLFSTPGSHPAAPPRPQAAHRVESGARSQGQSLPVRGPSEIASLIGRARGQASAEASGDVSVGSAGIEPPADAPAADSRSYLPLVVILTILLLSAAGLVLYFVLQSN